MSGPNTCMHCNLCILCTVQCALGVMSTTAARSRTSADLWIRVTIATASNVFSFDGTCSLCPMYTCKLRVMSPLFTCSSGCFYNANLAQPAPHWGCNGYSDRPQLWQCIAHSFSIFVGCGVRHILLDVHDITGMCNRELQGSLHTRAVCGDRCGSGRDCFGSTIIVRLTGSVIWRPKHTTHRRSIGDSEWAELWQYGSHSKCRNT